MADKEISFKSPGRPVSRASRTLTRYRQTAELRALGYTESKIARSLGVSQQTIAKDMKRPEVQESLSELRAQIKNILLSRAAKELVGPGVDMTIKAAKEDRAKDWDAGMRGLHALEKMTQSASGEAQKVDVAQTVTQIDRKELYARLDAFLSASS